MAGHDRASMGKLAADRLKLLSEALALYSDRFLEADPLECEALLEVMETCREHFELVYRTAHVLARGTLPPGEDQDSLNSPDH